MRHPGVAPVVAAGLAVALASQAGWRPRAEPVRAVTPPEVMASRVLCTLEADPTNKFTRVPPPPLPQTRGFAAQAAAITVTYTGFTSEAQAAFQYAVDIWQTQITSTVPIRIDAQFTVLGPSTLGSAGATYVYRDFPGAPVANTWYAKGLANRIGRTDFDPTSVDIQAQFNSRFGWYYGTDGLTPAGQYDFVSVVLHELAHGLGFFGSAAYSAGTGSWGFGTGYPVIYDRFVENLSGQSLLNTSLFPNPSTALGSQLTGGQLYWNGTRALAANGGARPRLYAPAVWKDGSSYSHLDEATYPAGSINSLMTYAIGAAEAIHDPGPIVRGMFADEGWVRHPVTGDYDLDAKSEVGVFRPSTGIWYLLMSSGGYATSSSRQWGISTDLPVPGDYDGDGRGDFAVYRPSTGMWYVLLSTTGYATSLTRAWGVGTDIPIAGDYDGDGRADLAVFRPTNATWYILRSTTNYTVGSQQPFGVVTDTPVPGDYDGDGRTDLAVYRPSTGMWFVLKSSTGGSTVMTKVWGTSADQPVPADYDGDDQTDFTVYRPSTGVWYVLKSSTLYGTWSATAWGVSTDLPVPGDYDGDGRTDLAVYRPSAGTWYILKSSSLNTLWFGVAWGSSGDIPLNRPPGS